MRKSTGMFLKQGLAALLSLSMIAGPCSPGIVPAFAAQIGSEEAAAAADVEKNATASDAERKSETSEASPSDALFDEDGFLLDGEVKDDAAGKTEAGEIEGGKNAEEETAGGKNAAGDVSREIVAAKTEKIAAAEALADGEWYSGYEYELDDDALTITLTKYLGDEDDIFVPAETEIDGTVYATVVENQRGYDDSVWAERQDTLTSIAFEEGVRLTGTAEDMFSEFTALKSVDLSGVDASEITETSGMFRLCEALEEVDLSRINIGNVEEMMQMFQGCASLEELDLSSLDTKNVTYMSEMFQECTSLKRMVLSGLDTGNLLGMDAMFKDCAALEYVDMSGIDTSNIELMMNVFENCTSLRTVDMTGVDMAGISDAVWGEGMLANCTSLETFYAPVNVAAEIGLPVTLYDEAGTAWTSLPQGLTESVRLSKTVKVSYVKINSTAKSIALGKTFQLRAWPQPVNAENKAVTWESSNPSVAAVDSTGLVTAVKAGTADVTVTTEDGGFTAVCKITVTVPVTSVKINSTAKTLEVGKTFQLAAWPQPTNATNKAVTWYSFNTSVATVSSNGLVTAKGTGSTNIRVMTKDGGKIAYCKITVEKPVIPAGYSVSAPTNVHWTDGFKLAWDYGRTQDGSVYQKWAYKMYNAETGAKIGSHSKKDTDGTSIEYFIKTGTIEKMTTGSYYFTVCALDADNNQISPEVRSELKAFTHPNAWAPKPYNLRWSGTKLLFEIPDSAKSKINRMSYDIYYSETENGTYSDKGMPHVMTNIDYARDFQSRFTKPGYYKFTLKVFNSDPRIIMPGEEAWSPVIHITN